METWLSEQKYCGPHEIDDERRNINRQLQKIVADLLPVDDPHKVNDVDLLYRFLIARKWDLKLAEEMFRANMQWRQENNIAGLLREKFPEDILENYPGGFMGVDIHGNPLYFDCPDPKGIVYLLGKYDRVVLLRWHILMMELARRRAKLLGKDRMTYVIDLKHVGVSIIGNPTASGFLKEITHIDQANYPECMRYMVILNAPWTFSTIWAFVRPLLDERVQKKINIIKGDISQEIVKFVALDQVPGVFGGTAGDWILMDKEIEDCQKALTLEDVRHVRMSVSPYDRAASAEAVANEADEFESVCSNDEDLERVRAELTQPEQGTLSAPEVMRLDEEALRRPRAEAIDTPTSPVSSPNFPANSKKIEMTKARNINGYPTTRAMFQGTFLGETSLNLIVVPSDGTTVGTSLLAELVSEPGHPVHVYVLVIDVSHVVHYILKRRRLHKEIEIFEPVSNTNNRLSKDMKFNGKSNQTMTCKPMQDQPVAHCWVIKRMEASPKRIVCQCRYDTLTWSQEEWCGSLSRVPPHIVFALCVGIQQLWEL